MDPRHLHSLLDLLRASPDFFALLDAQVRVLETDPGWASRLGFTPEELAGARLIDLIHRDDRAPLEDALRQLRDGLPAAPLRARVCARNHPHVELELALATARDAALMSIHARDASEDRQREDRVAAAERRLQALRRQESVALLAGGIVHHLNNLFCVSLGYLKLISAEVAEGSAARGFVSEVQGATDRAAELVRQLLGFARDTDGEVEIDVAATVRRLELLIRQLMSEQVAVAMELPERVPAVRGGRAQVDQLVINLVFGAREAMPDGGELRIAVHSVGDVPVAQRRPDTRPGPHVELAVAHRPRPARPEPRVRLIEPMPSWGARFGLTAAHHLASDVGGILLSDTGPDGTVTRTAYLPVTPPPATEAAAAARPIAARGQETILVVEDETQLRALIVRALRRHGYQVLVAGGGEEALRVAHGHRGALDLLLTDVVMPGMSGTEVAAALLSSMPGLRVLYMSGHTEATALGPEVLGSGAQTLAKPFRPAGLAQRVREVLDLRP